MMPNIYIVGKAGSGKDYITDIIKALYPGYRSVAIAEPLYEMVNCIKYDDKRGFMLILEDLGLNHNKSYMAWRRISDDIKEEVKDLSIIKPRKALQTLGDIVRSYHEYPLIIKAISKAIGPTIITDVRLPLEVEYLKKHDFIGVKVYSEESVRVKRLQDRDNLLDSSTLKHKTETQVDEITYDYLIDNTIGGKGILVDRIRDIVIGT